MKCGVELIRRPDPVPEGLKRIYEVCALEGKLVVVISEGVVFNGYLIQHAGSVLAEIYDRVWDCDDEYPNEVGPDPAAPGEIKPPERFQWWPEAVVCPNCDASVAIKEEPASYVIDCPFCNHSITVYPIDNPSSRVRSIAVNTETAVKEFSLGRSPKVEAAHKAAFSERMREIEQGIRECTGDTQEIEAVIDKIEVEADKLEAEADKLEEESRGILDMVKLAHGPTRAEEYADELAVDLARYEAQDRKRTVDRIIAEEDGHPVCSGCDGYDGKHTRPDCAGDFVPLLPADLAELDKEIAESERNA
jgi:hypothetical protein